MTNNTFETSQRFIQVDFHLDQQIVCTDSFEFWMFFLFDEKENIAGFNARLGKGAISTIQVVIRFHSIS